VTAHVGDRITVESERAAQSGRTGIIEEVLSDEPQRLRVRWDDGRMSIFVPSAGVAHISGAAAAKKKTVRRASA
jgi:hypothetical protein